MCYLVTIPEFGDGVTFHIVKKNFQVQVDPETVFESEAAMGNPIPPPPVDGERASGRNVVTGSHPSWANSLHFQFFRY